VTLREKRSVFTLLLCKLITEMFYRGFEATLGDVTASTGHKPGSFHYRGLAADINLFKNGVYLRKTEDHQQFGDYWKSLDDLCTWGGDFKRPDGNHYSFGEGRR